MTEEDPGHILRGRTAIMERNDQRPEKASGKE